MNINKPHDPTLQLIISHVSQRRQLSDRLYNYTINDVHAHTNIVILTLTSPSRLRWRDLT